MQLKVVRSKTTLISFNIFYSYYFSSYFLSRSASEGIPEIILSALYDERPLTDVSVRYSDDTSSRYSARYSPSGYTEYSDISDESIRSAVSTMRRLSLATTNRYSSPASSVDTTVSNRLFK